MSYMHSWHARRCIERLLDGKTAAHASEPQRLRRVRAGSAHLRVSRHASGSLTKGSQELDCAGITGGRGQRLTQGGGGGGDGGGGNGDGGAGAGSHGDRLRTRESTGGRFRECRRWADELARRSVAVRRWFERVGAYLVLTIGSKSRRGDAKYHRMTPGSE